MQYNLSNESYVDVAIRRLKEHEPKEGYFLAFSGGKDSIVCHQLCIMAGVKFITRYSMTTIDPVEVTRFIRDEYPHAIWIKPYYKGERTNFYKLVSLKGLPRRTVRWCCHYLKENGGVKGSTVVLGVRWAESVKREGRPIFGSRMGEYYLNPIIDWSNEDVWKFIKDHNLAYPSVYDNGAKRVGCILCPLACRKKRIEDYLKYPNHVAAIERALTIFLENHPHGTIWKCGANAHEIVYHWVYESPIKSAKGACMQTILDNGDELEETEDPYEEIY